MVSESDRLLIRQIRAGDSRAWESLIARYEGRLLAFVDRRLRDRAASEDVVQETFIGFLNSLPNFDENRELQTYLFTIAAHKLTDQLRRAGRHPLQGLMDSTGTMVHEPLDPRRAASSLVRSGERRQIESTALSQALGEMIGRWRERREFQRLKILELLFVKGWANRDVAAFLQTGEQQVANVRFAAVKKLSELIGAANLPAELFPELRTP